MTKTNRHSPRKPYYYTAPTGHEHLLGWYTSERIAKGVFTRNVSSDYRSFCVGPYEKPQTEGDPS